jgi:hypothetical protein
MITIMIINEFAKDGLEFDSIDLLLETSRSVTPRTKLPTSYYLAAASNLWVAVRFGMGNRLSRGGGDSGAIFDWFMNNTAKNAGIVVGISKNSRDTGEEYREHIVPCKLIVDRAIDIYQDGATPGELQDDKIEFNKIRQVAKLIRDNLFVVKITKDEASLIDKDLRLQTRMPSGWAWGDDVFARIGDAANAVTKSPELKKKFGSIQVYDINNPSTLIYK